MTAHDISRTGTGLDAHTESRLHMFGVWCGLGYVLMLLLGWAAVAGFFPPVHPYAGQSEIAHLFLRDHTRIRIGMIVVMFGALVFIPFAGVLAVHIKRIEGGVGILTLSSVMLGVGNMFLTFYPAMTWTVATFRPDRSPAATYLASDTAWLWFVGGASILLMMVPVAVAAFVDRNPDPVFPRWAGYLNAWIVVLIIPDQLLFFFHRGVFSWNGLIGLYVTVTAFTVWFGSTIYLLRKAVLRDRHTEQR